MALSRHHAALTTPRSVEALVQEAQEFEFSPNRALQQWLRAAKMLLTEASICEQEGNLATAYLYLYRHADLILSKLPEHPDYKNPRYKLELSQARKTVQRNLVKLEQWKPRINQDYQRYVKAMDRRSAERQRVQQEFDSAARRLSYDHSRRSSLASMSSRPPSPISTVSAMDNREFAVNLAQRELRRRDASRKSTAEAGIPAATVAERRRGLSRYTMPAPPARPAKESLHKYSASELPGRHPPPRPPRPDSLPTPGPPPSPPLVPSKYTFKPTAFTEAGAPLRTVLLPPDLRTQFLNVADPNTSRNLETCGILAGTLIANALFINTLIIPDQTSTSDTCDTTDQGEIDLFSYCDSNSLLVMGWIHTHPTQSCFLSSRDLHTSSGYQVMLPEAIAIVCSPRQNPDWGIFRLTDPPGLPHVLECRKPGIFHTHDEERLYTDALRPGHVVEGPGLQFEVVDLRKGKMKVTS
ncbi:hypothetical protein CERZMDRAFT_51302 [Cercospora zeae-maydis SCOH1-5]|uniref:MPN domain-containing protein n=1 Tax=Cercospora zeae-maydis SCOH1-5 TaxID=717836 RepID=A0A6A6F2I5_9PEZI|nr:hypothetical protein CERZMDRAFT_51302 [Cercospora zeae-maydis SCOH1-5]